MLKSLALLAFAAGSILSAGEQSKKLSGTWEARFEGAVFSVLRIDGGDKVIGTLRAGEIGVDNQGNLVSAVANGGEFPIRNARLANGILSFEWTGESTGESDDTPLTLGLKLVRIRPTCDS